MGHEAPGSGQPRQVLRGRATATTTTRYDYDDNGADYATKIRRPALRDFGLLFGATQVRRQEAGQVNR